jgi:SAM-dependent methyltransferase
MNFTGERFIPELSGQIELEHLNRYYFVIKQIDLTNKVVLDLASGEGYGSDLLAKYSKQVIGVDISNEAIEHAKLRYIKDNLNFTVGDVTQIPIASHSIDIAVCFETIEHHDRHVEMINEIVRVLKPDGILVISSPDKYYYSDLPNYKNEFHVKELYYEEFKNLISENFRFVKFFCQRLFNGSIIVLNEEDVNYNIPIVIENDGVINAFLPMYNISIASNGSPLKPTHQIIGYTSDMGALISKKYFDNKLEKIYNSRTWRTGKFFITPLKFLKRILTSLFVRFS